MMMNDKVGLLVLLARLGGMPTLPVAAQFGNGSVIAQSPELAEADRLEQQVIWLFQQGQYAEAIPLTERIVAIRKRVQGPQHPQVAGAIDSLASLYYSLGRYDQAEPLYVQVLELRKQIDNEHQDVASSLNTLALLYKSQGRF